MNRTLQAGWLCVVISLACLKADAGEDGFESIFDGRTLAGWQGQDMSFWTVEDEAITGSITPEHDAPMNQYLVYQGGLVENFELKLDFRLTGSTTPNTNGGFQFRSRRLPNGDVAGYQVDNNFGAPWKVRLYDEFGRHDLAVEGERSRFDALGKRHVTLLELAAGARDFKLDEWHEYHLIANGNRLSLAINGNLVAACTDGDAQQFEPMGVLAMQLHTGPPMKAQFRNLRLKKLPRTPPSSSRETLFAAAALDFQLGDRVETHQPPLTVHGEVKPNGRIADLASGWFNAGDWNTPGEAITAYLRAKAEGGKWSHGLFAKRGSHEETNFNLFSADLPETAGDDIGFEIHTDKGFFQASFPVSKVDAATWHDLIGRYDGKSLTIYCDGRLMASVPASGALTQNREPILIGAETADGQAVRPFTGQLERASLWSKALSQQEIDLILAQDPVAKSE